jgi:hypothetical protein
MPLKPFHIVPVLALLTLFSCTKEYSYEGQPPPAQGPADFRATIDGVLWVAADSARTASLIGGQINLAGISSDDKQLSITLNDTVTGVYTVNQLTSSLGSYVNLDSSAFYAFTTNHGVDTTQAGGTVTVTAIDRVNQTITGTFAFKVWRDVDSRGKNITNGVFNHIPYVNNLQAAGGGDTMRATIDGSAWVAQSIQATAVAPQVAITGSLLNGDQTVSLIFPLNTIPGSYVLDISGLQYIGIYNPVATTALTSSSGTLTILQNDATNKRIRGNFQFKATDPTGQSIVTDQLTSGYFSVKYN